jgi:hypothetical protein
MATVSELIELRNAFGPLVLVDYSEFGFVEAHRALGKEVRAQVWKILADKLDNLDIDPLRDRFRQACSCLELLKSRSHQSGLDLAILRAITEYLDCLQAWAQGAELAGFRHPRLEQVLDGRGPTEVELALFLQHDNVGCQTGIYRCQDGSVIFWHSEEDVGAPGERFDKLRIAKFSRIPGNDQIEMRAFIYPNLLPGPAFAWRNDGYVQAVDTLILLSMPEFEHAALVNVVSWLALRLGEQVELEKIIRALSPFWDGYALNNACVRDHRVNGNNYEFARDQIILSRLGNEADGFLFQVNFFCNRRNLTLKKIEALPQNRKRYLTIRTNRTHHKLRNKKDRIYSGHKLERAQAVEAFDYYFDHRDLQMDALRSDELEFFYDLLTSRAGSDTAYANLDVRAWFLAHISLQEMHIRVGPGAAI